MPMIPRRLGRTEFDLSPLALGTWAMAGAADAYGTVDDRESVAAIHQALDLGVRLIDTAPSYGAGHAEQVVGKALHGRRHEVLLASKCEVIPAQRTAIDRRESPTQLRIHDQCEQSLRRLRTEFIDLYQFHGPISAHSMREIMVSMSKLLQQGKIMAIGMVNVGLEDVTAAREFGPVHTLQFPFSMLRLRAADDLIPFCVEHEIAALPCSPLCHGLLTSKFTADSPLEGIRARTPEFIGNRFHRNMELVRELALIASGYEKSVTQLVLNWTATFPGVSALVFGAKRPSQVIENVTSLDWTLSPEDRHRIDTLVSLKKEKPE